MLSVMCGIILLNTGFVESSYNTVLKKYDVQPLVEQADEDDVSTWTGLKKIHLLTSQAHFELLVNMKRYTNGTGYASYSRFRVPDETQNFRLLLGTFKGNAGDSLAWHNGLEFSTYDRDKDYNKVNCAASYHGAWWYHGCHNSNLNGLYVHVKEKSQENTSSVTWYHWSSKYLPLQFSEMKIRPVNIH
ncbi:fibrinogen C domain-containing protein 1-like [Liolophura sinensis]|uniref:fibrinogen C domain-containing protein 1-like n=1 Tax=Liolophura sinensis TaxID=3198878 RepID=UPI0031589961